jgi:hypothetical protein
VLDGFNDVRPGVLCLPAINEVHEADETKHPGDGQGRQQNVPHREMGTVLFCYASHRTASLSILVSFVKQKQPGEDSPG